MNSFDYQFKAQLHRWLHRERPGRLAVALGESVGKQASRIAKRRRNILSLETPALVVGSLTLGGAGKTPVAALIAETLHRDYGYRTALVCRGWGGVETATRVVQTTSPGQDGDEAAMLRARLPGEIVLWASRDLEAGRRGASSEADVVVIDDGLQTAKLARSHNVVVIDATAPRRMLPAGPYREPLNTLRRDDFIWVHKVDEPEARPLDVSVKADVRSRYVARSVVLPDGRCVPATWLEGREVVAVCGIGRPESFLHQLELLGAKVKGGIICDDHRSASPERLAKISKDACIVTTAKDAVRWSGSDRPAVLNVGIDILEGGERLRDFLRALEPPC